MVNVLISNKNDHESDLICKELKNDRNYNIKNVNTGIDTLNTYWKDNPDILVLDNNISDLSIEDVIGRLSINPIENKKCNTILTLDKTYKFEITTKLTKINEVILKSIIDNKLSNFILRE